MADVIDFPSGKVLPLNQLQREWVELVSNESVDNLDLADIVDLVQGMEEYYGSDDQTA